MWLRRVAGAFAIVIAAVAAKTAPARAQRERPATLTGRVLLDDGVHPIPDVEVTIATLSRSVTTDATGGFTLQGIPAGLYTVVARRIGFARYESQIVFDSGATVERRILLPKLQTLDSARIVGDSYLPLSFIDHRARGFGHFMTREELAETGLATLSNAISQIPGISIARGTRGEGWVLSNHHMSSIRSITQLENHPGDDTYVPDAAEMRSGLGRGCYARVYLDSQLLNPSTPAEPINVNEFSPDRLEAIEFYSRPAQTPPEYSRLNSTCGVLVLHTRRSP